ncbi:2-dehydro-3-deoxygalactonokinase [Rhizobiales bacterium GAS191]|nr:2-dehydro-3-deoxygalactonokinase [Rhizobiales bacterium GAS191]
MPEATPSPHCIVLDWGTTNFRAVLVDASGTILDRIETQDGIQSVPKSGFEAALAERIAPWWAAHGLLPIYASGMIGSRNGWVEMPYVAAPAGIEDFAKAVRRVALRDGGSILFIPGLTDTAVKPFADVMRGEETQLVGFGLDRDATVVLPGTHSKWARIAQGRIASFRTFVTGEIFGIVSRHSFLSQVAKPQALPDWTAFARGLDTARDPKAASGLLSRLFSVRTGWLAGELDAGEMTDYLSGLVVGSEFREARELGWFKEGQEVGIIGAELMAEVYRRAAEAFGLKPRLGPTDAAMRGCLAIAKVAESSGRQAKAKPAAGVTS